MHFLNGCRKQTRQVAIYSVGKQPLPQAGEVWNKSAFLRAL
jgi:hypothetical protein